MNVRELTGKVWRRKQLAELREMGFRQGRDYWIRSTGEIVLNPAMFSRGKMEKPTEPDFSSIGPQAHNSQTPAAEAIRPARAVSAKA